MSIPLPQPVRSLLEDKAYGHVVTVTATGRPRVTMVWMDVDGDEVVFNTAEGRKKVQDLRRDPRVIVSVQDRNDSQSYAVFHGQARITTDGAREHIDKLTKRFLGIDQYPGPPGETRLIVRIGVERIGGVAPGYKPWT
ncbi:MAG: PPOX class F420-dependent oxidoreductase [Vicinamibacterales bacterium]